MPLLLGFQTLQPLIIIQTLLLGNTLQHFLDSRHHALQATKVNVSTLVKFVKHFICIFLHFVLDVHFSSLSIGLFSRQSIIQTEVIWEASFDILELIIIQESIRIGNTKEEPSLTLVCFRSWSFLKKEAPDKPTIRSNSCSSCNHDVVSGRILFWHKHDFSCRSCHLDLITWLGVTQEIGANSFLGRILSFEFRAPICGTSDT
mmetsp:Transcript_9287/g.16635  ORF Transcript_9287/g.16635 Transcript_9287/m.16635 type:complete len:203 (+) Transcript_9287:68-676(+)